MPGRPRPPRPHPGPGPGRGDGPAEGDQDRPVPFFGHRTARPTRCRPPGSRRRDKRCPGPSGRPEPRRRPRRPAQSRPVRPQRRPLMIAKYAIALIVLIVLAATFTWAFLPARYLPGNRAAPADPAAPAATPRQRLRPRLQP